eukprot:m.99903 g.99903  ORF g.99903 m.99903 type:complete len:323 (-) comp8734_c0_seq5:112-1080(-)
MSEMPVIPSAPALTLVPSDAPRTAFLFPGQGSQEPKMLASVLSIPAVQEMLDKAKDILGYDLQEIIMNGSEDIHKTIYCQPALLIAGLAAVEKLSRDQSDAVRFCEGAAGLSLGEYTALVFAQAISFEDALRLVKIRAEAMQRCADTRKGEMLSVVGLDDPDLQAMCDQAAAATGQTVRIANYLFKQGRVVSGEPAAIAEVTRLATPKATKVMLLKVSGAFHSSLMDGARDDLKRALADTTIRMPCVTVYANTTGRPYTSVEEIREQLYEQVVQPVRWEASVQAMVKGNYSGFYELGPRDQLKAMMRRIDLGAWKRTYNVTV